MCLECEVACVEEVALGAGQVSKVGLGARSTEYLVVLAPGDEQRRLVSAEILLEPGVAVEVELVVPEQLQLDGIVAFAVESRLIERPRLGGDAIESIRGHPVGVLPPCGLGGEVFADRVLVGGPVPGMGEEDVP